MASLILVHAVIAWPLFFGLTFPSPQIKWWGTGAHPQNIYNISSPQNEWWGGWVKDARISEYLASNEIYQGWVEPPSIIYRDLAYPGDPHPSVMFLSVW